MFRPSASKTMADDLETYPEQHSNLNGTEVKIYVLVGPRKRVEADRWLKKLETDLRPHLSAAWEGKISFCSLEKAGRCPSCGRDERRRYVIDR